MAALVAQRFRDAGPAHQTLRVLQREPLYEQAVKFRLGSAGARHSLAVRRRRLHSARSASHGEFEQVPKAEGRPNAGVAAGDLRRRLCTARQRRRCCTGAPHVVVGEPLQPGGLPACCRLEQIQRSAVLALVPDSRPALPRRRRLMRRRASWSLQAGPWPKPQPDYDPAAPISRSLADAPTADVTGRGTQQDREEQ